MKSGKFTIRLCSTNKIPNFQQLFNEGFKADTWNNLQNKINQIPSKIREFMASKGPNKEWGWWPNTKPRKLGKGCSPVMNFIMYIDNSNNLNDIIDEIKEFIKVTYISFSKELDCHKDGLLPLKRNMKSIEILEMQYSVGQGGLHLGIIGTTAYLYDCGCRSSVKTKKMYGDYFENICYHIKSRNVEKFYIYISHLHDDHVNLLPEFIKYAKRQSIRIATVYIPKINEPEKIILLLQYEGSDYQSYYEMIEDPAKYFGVDVKEIPKEESDIGRVTIKNYGILSWILDPFVDGKEIPQLNIPYKLKDLEDYSKIKKLKKKCEKKFLSKIKNFHGVMLCLYSGPEDYGFNGYLKCACSNGHWESCCPHSFCEIIRAGWLHTGDIILKKRQGTYFYKKYKKYINYIGVFQIPHHGSKYNHYPDLLTDMFGNDLSRRIFYLTHSLCDGNAKPSINDIKNLSNVFHVSEYQHTGLILTILENKP